jgi:hypothetical protein
MMTTDPRAYFERLPWHVDAEALQLLTNIVGAQLVAEDLRESDPAWSEIIVPPDGAAPAAICRTFLDVAAAHGFRPDPGRFEESARMLAGGVTCLRWPYGTD